MQEVELHLVTRKCYHVVACRLLAWSTRCSLLDSLCQLFMPGHRFGCLEALPMTNALVSPLQSGLSASDGCELRHVLAHVKRHGSWAAGHHIMPKAVAWRLPWLLCFLCRQCCQRPERGGTASAALPHQMSTAAPQAALQQACRAHGLSNAGHAAVAANWLHLGDLRCLLHLSAAAGAHLDQADVHVRWLPARRLHCKQADTCLHAALDCLPLQTAQRRQHHLHPA